MSGTVFLQAFLIFDVFLAGALVTLAIQHAHAHFHARREVSSQAPAVTEPLPDDIRRQVVQASEAQFKATLEHFGVQLQRDLATTAASINKLLGHMGATVVGDELERYRVDLEKLHQQAAANVTAIHTGLAAHETELKAKMAAELEAEKQRLIKQLDTKLAEAVSAFLVETLQHEADLGAQSAYLMAMLEQHKDELMKGVDDGATPTAR
ncbi:MAG TPA: hypothetical protein VHC98_00865 [Candidatus Saccharimonadales bacterium]|nr:hypothetical protein [Candidatus Saccharimonadales bacterium]